MTAAAEQAGLTAERARDIGEDLLRRVSADDALVSITHFRQATTRFSNNSVAFHASTDKHEVSLTVHFGQQKGTATAESIEGADLEELARRAEEIAREAPPDPETLPTLGPQEYVAVEAFRRATAEASPEDLTELASRICIPALRANLNASGTIETSVASVALLSKRGLFAYHRGTQSEIGCTVATPTSSGWARGYDPDLSRLDQAALFARAAEQARMAENPGEIAPGKYTVLLMPAAVGSLAQLLLWWANARLTGEGLTYLTGRVGEKLAPDEITLYSDPQDRLLPCDPFYEEGLPRSRTVWIDRGRFLQLWHDRWTAHQAGVAPVALPGNLLMPGTRRTVEELVSGIERGVLVNHLWYIRTVKADQTLVTAMTRDGTFWIEDGKIRHGLKNMRFNESCLGMLQRTVALGTPEVCVDREMPPSSFPPLVVKDWNFVGVSGS